MNAREEVLARIAAAYRAAPPAEVGYGDITRDYRTTSDLEAAALTELLIDRLVDYRALVRQCSADDLGAEIADALAKMFAELKPKIMAKYSLEDEQVILLAIAKAAVKLGTNSMQAGSLTPDQTEKLERKLQNIMLNAFMFGEVDDD